MIGGTSIIKENITRLRDDYKYLYLQTKDTKILSRISESLSYIEKYIDKCNLTILPQRLIDNIKIRTNSISNNQAELLNLHDEILAIQGKSLYKWTGNTIIIAPIRFAIISSSSEDRLMKSISVCIMANDTSTIKILYLPESFITGAIVSVDLELITKLTIQGSVRNVNELFLKFSYVEIVDINRFNDRISCSTLTTLEIDDCEYNPFNHRLPNLTNLTITNTNIPLIDSQLENYPKLIKLTLNKVSIGELSHIGRICLEVLIIQSSRIDRISTNCFEGLTYLIQLQMVDCGIKELHETIFHGLDSLQMINLSRNGLRSNRFMLKNVLTILDGNPISTIDKSYIDLMNSNISTILCI